MATRNGATLRLLAGCLLLLAGPAARGEAPPGYANPCPARGAVIAVFSRTHELYLCRDGELSGRILVALGRGGIGKRRRGDRRTPLGSYALGRPRPSRSFRTFIPILYPTSEQMARGFTGGGLGIHGPPRGWRDPAAATAFDWTRGCIATGTDAEIERIARFVREHQPVVVIRPAPSGRDDP
jgi:hypothetical protein